MLFPFLPCHVTKSRPLLVDSITDLVIEVLLTSFAFSNSHSLAFPKMFNVYIYTGGMLYINGSEITI